MDLRGPQAREGKKPFRARLALTSVNPVTGKASTKSTTVTLKPYGRYQRSMYAARKSPITPRWSSGSDAANP